MEIGTAVELMGVENAGLDITGQRGIVIADPGHGFVTVKLDGSGRMDAPPSLLTLPHPCSRPAFLPRWPWHRRARDDLPHEDERPVAPDAGLQPRRHKA